MTERLKISVCVLAGLLTFLPMLFGRYKLREENHILEGYYRINSFLSTISGLKEESVICMGEWGLEEELEDENIKIYVSHVLSL
jgi:hypothetical protein